MNQHPYVGLKATRPGMSRNGNREIVGTVAFVGTGGSVNEDSCVETFATLLLDDGTHFDACLSEIVVDPIEARARLTGGAS